MSEASQEIYDAIRNSGLDVEDLYLESTPKGSIKTRIGYSRYPSILAVTNANLVVAWKQQGISGEYRVFAGLLMPDNTRYTIPDVERQIAKETEKKQRAMKAKYPGPYTFNPSDYEKY